MKNPLPANEGLERALIGAVLNDNNIFDEVSSILKHIHFNSQLNARAWKFVAEELERGGVTSPELICHRFNGSRDAALHELNAMRQRPCPSSQAIKYAKRIVELYQRRQTIVLAGRLIEQAANLEGSSTILSLMSDFQARIGEIATADAEFTHLSDAVGELIERANELRMSGKTPGISTGWPSLDRATGGMRPGQGWVLGARTSHGKTATAINMALHQALSGIPVGYLSLETIVSALCERMMASATGIPTQAIRDGKRGDVRINEDAAWESSMKSMMDFHIRSKNIPLHLVDFSKLSADTLEASLLELARIGCKVIYIDYVQLISSRGERSLREEVMRVIEVVRSVLKRKKITIVTLAQLNREMDKRGNQDKYPRASDLGECSRLEHDADVLFFSFREAKYLGEHGPDLTPAVRGQPLTDSEIRTRWLLHRQKIQACERDLKLIVGKNRDGATGQHLEFDFDGATMKIRELAENAAQS